MPFELHLSLRRPRVDQLELPRPPGSTICAERACRAPCAYGSGGGVQHLQLAVVEARPRRDLAVLADVVTTPSVSARKIGRCSSLTRAGNLQRRAPLSASHSSAVPSAAAVEQRAAARQLGLRARHAVIRRFASAAPSAS